MHAKSHFLPNILDLAHIRDSQVMKYYPYFSVASHLNGSNTWLQLKRLEDWMEFHAKYLGLIIFKAQVNSLDKFVRSRQEICNLIEETNIYSGY